MTPHILMVQGTTSDAGKSTLVAGICRVLKRRGVAVAPFKPQNMALNSAVTHDGGEIGRAQALQAQACEVPTSVHMNPILLKPSSDTGAQVIVQGQALTQMEAQGFHDYKKVAMDAVLDSLDKLQEDYSTIVVEGAGSPAEINLRENDIANMGFAEKVDCPVILVADIDRGGVFAHLVGTLNLLSQSEQNRVVGFVINRFRGDISLLEPGLDWLEEKTGKPVLGVLPYLTNLYLDAEDAISIEQEISNDEVVLNVVVPVLPRISNHTDFDSLRLHPNVNLQYCALDEKNIQADLIILPGSKNVRADLAALLAHGWKEKLNHHLRYGGKLIGICGGYQMLGVSISDPHGIEDAPGRSEGLSYLNITTQLHAEKLLQYSQGLLHLNGKSANITGYEIHCGMTQVDERPLIKTESGHDGCVSADNQILGSYFHGLFDTASTCEMLLSWAGLKNVKAVDLSLKREQQINRLADAIEKHIDFSKLEPFFITEKVGVSNYVFPVSD